MELHQFRTDGSKDISDMGSHAVTQGAKRVALDIVTYPNASGVYRIQFVDSEYDRVLWDTYHPATPAPAFGAVVFAGAS